jgi:hypothetical protein
MCAAVGLKRKRYRAAYLQQRLGQMPDMLQSMACDIRFINEAVRTGHRFAMKEKQAFV